MIGSGRQNLSSIENLVVGVRFALEYFVIQTGVEIVGRNKDLLAPTVTSGWSPSNA